MAVEGGLGREKSRDDGSGAFDSLNSKEPAVAVKNRPKAESQSMTISN